MDEWKRGLDMFDVYYRSQCGYLLEDFTSSEERRKYQPALERSKLEAAKRRLFEDKL